MQGQAASPKTRLFRLLPAKHTDRRSARGLRAQKGDCFYLNAEKMVRSRRLELPRVLPHSDLNAARLPIPPRPHGRTCFGPLKSAVNSRDRRVANCRGAHKPGKSGACRIEPPKSRRRPHGPARECRIHPCRCPPSDPTDSRRPPSPGRCTACNRWTDSRPSPADAGATYGPRYRS